MTLKLVFEDFPREEILEYLKMIQEASEPKEIPRWIPIKERIPAPGRNILVCDSDGDIYVSYMRTDHTFGFDTSGNRIKNVVAWMWAPEPYKESEE
jgi:hypothetical protein